MKDVLVKDYKIIDAIGEGGMATVYLAEHQLLGHKVAVKILKEELVGNRNIRSRFIAEAKNMARMSHPNIIKVTDLIEEEDTVAFVMEYIEGETLKEFLDRKGKLSDEEIKTLFTQMLDAVGYVHDQNLVHRDIKPSNFMIDKNGKVKLMDFGIAKTLDPTSAEYTQTGTGVLMGTPMYMSPEQVTESKSITSQSDIYSLGVVLWQMVTGQKPYNTDTLSAFQIQFKIVMEKLPVTGYSFDGLIEQATAKELEKRFLDCKVFKNELENLFGLKGTHQPTQQVNNAKALEVTLINETFVYDNCGCKLSIVNCNERKIIIKAKGTNVIGEGLIVDFFLNGEFKLRFKSTDGFSCEKINLSSQPKIYLFGGIFFWNNVKLPILDIKKSYLIILEFLPFYNYRATSIIEI